MVLTKRYTIFAGFSVFVVGLYLAHSYFSVLSLPILWPWQVPRSANTIPAFSETSVRIHIGIVMMALKPANVGNSMEELWTSAIVTGNLQTCHVQLDRHCHSTIHPRAPDCL
jgi:hypothetical protein